MKQVDSEVDSIVGGSYLDLPDWGYRDAFDDGMNPKSAARKAIRNAKEG
jgi:hypothetical protein